MRRVEDDSVNSPFLDPCRRKTLGYQVHRLIKRILDRDLGAGLDERGLQGLGRAVGVLAYPRPEGQPEDMHVASVEPSQGLGKPLDLLLWLLLVDASAEF